MSAVVGTLLRRGLELGAAHFQKEPKEQYQVPAWGVFIMGVTVLFFITANTMISYTFGHIVTTLLIVESPESIVFEPISGNEPDAPADNINKAPEPELFLMKQQPITSSFRQTLELLTLKGGFRARFRGMSIFIVYSLIVGLVSELFGVFIVILSPFVARFVAPIIATVACAQLGVAWTHIVISDPSPKSWIHRIPGRSSWKRVAGPTAIVALAEQIAIYIPAYVALATGVMGSPGDFANGSHGERSATAATGLGFLLVSIGLFVSVAVPAHVVLTRVQASILPDEAESIVPFDRSFGGKVEPAIIGGAGVIGMRDAWNTFDWNSRVRLIKAYAKVFAMQFALSLLFFAVMGAQIALIIGSNLERVFPGEESDREI